MSTERESLIRDICEQPEEDTARLVYADWLQENGRQARAEFIRAQIALTELEKRLGSTLIAGPEQRRVRDLWPAADYDILDEVRPTKVIPDDMIVFKGDEWRVGYPRPGAYVIRGFIQHVELPYEQFMAHHGELFSAHPITSVGITDFGFGFLSDARVSPRIRINNLKKAQHSVGSPAGRVTYLPLSFKDCVRGGNWLGDYGDRAYASLEEAQKELSAAFVRWGREKAGLPQLDAQEAPV